MSPRINQWLGALGALAMLSAMGSSHAAGGLRGAYYQVAPLGLSQPNRGQLFGCKSPIFNRVDPQVDVDWGTNPPQDENGGAPPPLPGGADFPGDGFAVRWTGIFTPNASGPKVFTIRTDDGGRLWIKDKDQGPISGSDPANAAGWADQGPTDANTAPFTVTAGHQYYIMAEMYENGGGAYAQLRWRDPAEDAVTTHIADGNTQVITTDLLTPADAPAAPAADTTAPGAITGLAASDITATTAKLTFTATGDDAATGTAGCYEVKWSTQPITQANFDLASAANVGTLMPDPAGASQSFTLNGLPFLDKIFVAIRAVDEAGNKGPISNVATFPTGGTIAYPEHGVTTENFRNISGTCLDVADNGLKTQAKYIGDAPDDFAFYPHYELYSVADLNVVPGNNQQDNFGTRMRAIFTAPTTGNYTFYEAADDDAELDISDPVAAAATPDISTLKAIAGNPTCNWAPDLAWGRFSQDGPIDDDPATPHNETTDASVSKPIALTAGQKILIQLIRQEGGGGENMAVGAIFPDGTDGTGTVAVDPNIGFANGNNQPSATEIAQPDFMKPLNTKYLAPWPLPVKGRLHGVVKAADGTPIAGASISATDGASLNATGTTDGLGAFSILAKPGTYNMTVNGTMPNGVRGTGASSAASTVVANAIAADVTITMNQIALPATLPAPVDKAVYRDAAETTGWNGADNADRVNDFFVAKGFTSVDAVGLKTFMQAHVGAGKPASVVVFANDIEPSSVVALKDNAAGTGKEIITDPKPLLRQYLDSGGRVVFIADIPFYNISDAGANVNPADGGAPAVLGFNTSSKPRDVGAKPVLTPVAKDTFGLSQIWSRGLRPADPGLVDITLAKDPNGNANGWAKLYPDITGSGAAFRLVDDDPDELDPTDPATLHPLTDEMINDVFKVATFGGALPGGVVVPPTGCKGDADGSGAIDVADAVAQLQHITGIKLLDGQNLLNADVNTGGVDVTDAVSVLQAIVGIPNADNISLTCAP